MRRPNQFVVPDAFREERQVLDESLPLLSEPQFKAYVLLGQALFHEDPYEWLMKPLNQEALVAVLSTTPKTDGEWLMLALLGNAYPKLCLPQPQADSLGDVDSDFIKYLHQRSYQGAAVNPEMDWLAFEETRKASHHLELIQHCHEAAIEQPKGEAANTARNLLRVALQNNLGGAYVSVADLFPVASITERGSFISDSLTELMMLNVCSQTLGVNTWENFLKLDIVQEVKALAKKQIETIPNTPLPRGKERFMLYLWMMARVKAIIASYVCQHPLPLAKD